MRCARASAPTAKPPRWFKRTQHKETSGRRRPLRRSSYPRCFKKEIYPSVQREILKFFFQANAVG